MDLDSGMCSSQSPPAASEVGPMSRARWVLSSGEMEPSDQPAPDEAPPES